jgi:hypothetical protein
MKEIIGYKVLRRNLASRLEAIAEGGIFYKLDEWVYPKRKCGPLAVFNSRKRALDFMRNYCGSVLYKVRYTESKRRELWDPFSTCDNVPTGTCFANKVMLLTRCHVRGC